MIRDDLTMLDLHLKFAEKELRELKTSQLDAFATAALSGLCAANGSDSADWLAERAYKIGDAMAQVKRKRAGLAV